MDIVKRLRAVDFSFWYQPLGGFDAAQNLSDMPAFEIGKMAHEAADEIERLRFKNDLDPSEKDRRIEALTGALRAVAAVLQQPSQFQTMTKNADDMQRQVWEMRANSDICLMIINQIIGTA